MNNERSERIAKKILTAIILIFIVGLSSYIILFSFGLKVDWNNFRIIQTSILSVSTTPRGADIYLDGRDLGKNTPFNLRWIIPETYRLELKKEGYHSFNHQIDLDAGLVTEINNLRLFRSQPLVKKIAEAEQIEMVSNSSGYLVDQKKVRFFSINPSKVRKIYIYEKGIESFLANKDFTKAVINQDQVIDLLSGNLILCLDMNYKRYSKFQFLGNDRLIAKKKGILYTIDISNRTADKLFDIKRIKEYLIVDSKIYYLTKSESTQLVSIDESNNRHIIAKNTLTVDDGEKDRIISLDRLSLEKISNKLFLNFQDEQILIDGDRRIIFNDGKSVKKISKQSSNSYIVVNDLNEVYRRDLTGVDNNQTIIRVSQKVNKAEYLAKDYLIYGQADDLYVYSTEYKTGWNINGDLKIDDFWKVNSKKILVKTNQNQLLELTIN